MSTIIYTHSHSSSPLYKQKALVTHTHKQVGSLLWLTLYVTSKNKLLIMSQHEHSKDKVGLIQNSKFGQIIISRCALLCSHYAVHCCFIKNILNINFNDILFSCAKYLNTVCNPVTSYPLKKYISYHFGNREVTSLGSFLKQGK